MLIFSHFIVPELGPDVKFSYASHKAVEEYKEAKAVCFYFNSIVRLFYPLTNWIYRIGIFWRFIKI